MALRDDVDAGLVRDVQFREEWGKETNLRLWVLWALNELPNAYKSTLKSEKRPSG